MTKLIAPLIALGAMLVPFSSFAAAKSSFFQLDPREPVDIMIVIAADVSGSVTGGPIYNSAMAEMEYVEDEYSLQKQGIAEALRDPEVSQLLEQCSVNGVALTYIEWSGRTNAELISQRVGWSKITSGSDLVRFASQLESFKQRSSNENTDIVSALRFSANLFETASFQSARKIISISSDGIQNVAANEDKNKGEDANIQALQREKERLIAQGFTIDALVILNDSSLSKDLVLKDYYTENVIGGPGATLTPIANFHDYAKGFKTKLLRELDNCIY